MPHSQLMDRLREATREPHDLLDALPYFETLRQGEAPLESYVAHLRALAVLHATLERALSETADDRIQEVLTGMVARFPTIQADLNFFAAKEVLEIPAASKAAGALASDVTRRSIESPVSLLGYLYVLEGSTEGAVVLAPLLAQNFSLAENRGMTYFVSDTTAAKDRWRDFGSRMNALPVDTAEADAIVAAACEAFDGFRLLFSALYPFDAAELSRRVTSLNPEAGAHEITSDPQESDATLRAGARCWEEFPYFSWRYGERGWRFTESDGAWLVTLASQPQSRVNAQVKWLAGVLSFRGMPSLLLQRHLELIYEEANGRVPQRPGTDYQKLLNAADGLADSRRAVMADADFETISRTFDQGAGPDWRGRLPNTGSILASAAADRANGKQAAVSSLDFWFTDQQRFPRQWVDAVRETLRKAEELTQGGSARESDAS